MKKSAILILLVGILCFLNINIYSQDDDPTAKKYDLKIQLKKDLKFTKSTKTNTTFEGEYKDKGKVQKSSSAQNVSKKFNYTILELISGKISKLKIEFLEQSTKSNKNNKFEKRNNEFLKKIEKEWIVVKLSSKGYEILEKSKNLEKLLKLDNTKDEKRNTQYSNAILFKYFLQEQLLFVNFTPEKAVKVGESWKINKLKLYANPFVGSPQTQEKSKENEDTKEKTEEETQKKSDNADFLTFTLEKIESDGSNEIATIKVSQKSEISDTYEMSNKSEEKYVNKTNLKGTILFDIKNKLILSEKIEVESTLTSYRNNKQFGNSTFKSIMENKYEYSK